MATLNIFRDFQTVLKRAKGDADNRKRKRRRAKIGGEAGLISK